MIKSIFVTLFFISYSFCYESYDLKLYENVLYSIFKVRPIRIFADNEVAEILKNSDEFIVKNSCDKNITVIVGKNFKNISEVCKDKPIFATSYKLYKHNKNSFGAFYWRKGRPQLKFKQKALKSFGIELPKSLLKFMER